MSDSKIKKAIKKGFLSGFIASLCCVGPLFIVFLGLGSISFAIALGSYSLYFLILGFFFLLASIAYYLYNKKKKCNLKCSNIELIKKEKEFIISAIISAIVIYIIAIYFIVPLLSPVVYKTNAKQSNQESNLHLLEISIDGMYCSGCAYGIESILENTEGIIDANISYLKSNGIILYDPKIISKEEILKSDAFKTYPAQIISDKEKR